MTCVHHWKLGSPAGLTSEGRCKHCGAQREFMNVHPQDSIEGMKWKDQSRVRVRKVER